MGRVDDDVMFPYAYVSRCRVELQRVTEIVPLFVPELIYVRKVTGVVVAHMERERVYVTRSYPQRQVVNRVAIMDGTMDDCVPIGGVALENRIPR